MEKGGKIAKKCVEISSKNFSDLESEYDGKKYPEDVYERIISSVKRNRGLSKQSLREAILWKYGKWPQFNKGKDYPPNCKKVFNAIAQNLTKMNELYCSNIEQNSKIEKMRQKLDKVLSKNSIVTKAWILHIYFPEYCKIIDKNTFIAMRCIQKLKRINIRPRTWEDVREYECFFERYKTHHSMTDRSLDKCLMVFGIELKKEVKLSGT